MQLTSNFKLSEMTASTTAVKLGLDNTPTPEALQRLVVTAKMLERVRAHLQVPVTVTSGYRSRAVNEAVGGVTSSDHAQGYAADIVAPRYGTPYQIAKSLAPLISALGIGQVIYESVAGKQWVHLSVCVPAKPVNRVITCPAPGVYLPGIQEV